MGRFQRWLSRKRGYGLSLRVRLIAVTVLTLVPALGIVIVSTLEQREQGVEAAQRQALQWASMAAEQHARHLAVTRQTLDTLSLMPQVQQPQDGTCPQLLGKVLRDNPLFAGLTVADIQGNVICSGLPLPGPVNYADSPWFQQLVATGDENGGVFQTGRVTNQPVITVAHPVLEDGRLVAVLAASLDLSWLNETLDMSNFPSGTSLTLFNPNHTVLLRYPDPGPWSGQRVSHESAAFELLAGAENRATDRGKGLEGEDVVYGFVRLEDGHASVKLSLPARVAFADANQAFRQNVGLLGIGLVVALALAWGTSHMFVVGPVQGLLHATTRIRSGDYSAPLGPPYEAGELGSLARSFDAMAATLEDRRREREQFVASIQAASERAEQAYWLLAEVTALLARSTDHQATVEETARAVVPALADGCFVHIIEPFSPPRLAALTHRNGEVELKLRALGAHRSDKQGPLLTLLGIAGMAADAGPSSIPDIESQARQEGVLDEPAVQLLLQGGTRNALIMPLRARGGHVGTMILLGDQEGRFGGGQRQTAESLAAICALAVDTARLYEEEQQARRAEVAAKAQVTSILESITDGFYALDREWRFTYVNQEAERLLRRKRNELIGRNIWEEFPEAVESTLYSAHQRAMGEQVSVRLEEFSARLELWMEVNVYPSENGLAVYFQDIGDRKQAEAALREADRQKDEFLAVLAHELRNPLAAIYSAVDLHSTVGSADSGLQEAWELVDHQAKHMKRLLDDLLDLARITRGKISLQNEVLDADRVVDQAVRMVRPLIDRRRHTLRVSMDRSLVVHGDPARLTQVLGNLLDNAAKYTPEGGSIEFSAEATPDHVIFRVRDNGPGIPPEALPSLFEPFSKSKMRHGSRDGLGLGLALVRKLLELHGGSVGVRTPEDGRGSEFIVRLPRYQQSRREAVPVLPAGSNDVERHALRLLLVEDEPALSKLMARLLKTRGYQVQTAEDGPTALELAKTFVPEVVLVDIGLPGISGLEVARRMRREPETHRAVIIALSGFGLPQDLQRSKKAGCDDHLVKPVDLRLLERTIKSCRSETQAARPSSLEGERVAAPAAPS